MTRLSQHAEWLSLVEVSGPFLTVSLLEKIFPQGLDAVTTPRRQKLRAAYEEWREAIDQEDALLPALHQEWIRLVLRELLEYDHESLIQRGDWKGEPLEISSQERTGSFRPDWIVCSPSDKKPRLLIAVLPPDADLASFQKGDHWPVSLQERMTLLCRAHGVRLGLLTNGERWMLVNAPVGSTSSQASWYARLWFLEPITLKAFQSLLGVRRCFGPDTDTLEALLDESLKHQEEITDTLGEQVRRAVEVLVQCLDKSDEDRNRELLRDVNPTELYEAGLTVMMRLVFLLCAEERGLLLLGDAVYDRCYAISTLRGQLAEEADRHGPEVLDRRHDAWARLLAVFRGVYAGIEHESLRMPALGGSLFDPDRYPFLEGRSKGTRWKESSAAPLPIDNRTVLLLLNALQLLEQSSGALLLSYRALDVEQIGHVYEGLLEHTVVRVPRVTLGLLGSQKAKIPNVALAELESAKLDGETTLLTLINTITQRSESAIKNALSKPANETIFSRVMGVCGGDTELAQRIRPFTNLLRTDAWDDPIIYRENAFMITLGSDRRETGTHYTPKSLTESIVTTTLEPVVYIGPAEGIPREEWKLKSPSEILDLKVCDPAMGSGAFLVQACRYLSEKLVEAWLHEESAGSAITVDGEVFNQLGAAEPMPSQLDERMTIARRLVAERCLYGVDINPLAVELAKLSIWLITLAKGRPFGFLEHNMRCGDSLLGLHKLEQLTKFSLHPEDKPVVSIFASNIETTVKDVLSLRKQIRGTQIRDIRDIHNMERLDQQGRQKLEHIEHIADAMIGEALVSYGNLRTLDNSIDNLATWAAAYIEGNNETGQKIIAEARRALSIDIPTGKLPRKPFHWPLEFPEVFKRGGFDGIVGNPPFMGGQKITDSLGTSYREFLVNWVADSIRGSADLCAYFFLNSYRLIHHSGTLGLIGTNTISQGDTRIVGLQKIISNDAKIYHRLENYRWPGKAAVVISAVFIKKGKWNRNSYSSQLKIIDCSNSKEWVVYQLKVNQDLAYIGSQLSGEGFKLSKGEAEQYIKENPKCSEVIFPILRGEDITDLPEQNAQQLVINFYDWSEEQVIKYTPCYQHLKERVYPERQKVKRKARREKWWQYAEKCTALYKEIAELDEVIVQPFYSKYICPSIVSSRQVFSAPMVVFTTSSSSLLSCLQSIFHIEWVIANSSTIGEGQRYTPSDSLRTFPFPENIEKNIHLHEFGLKYHNFRKEIMLAERVGVTDLYNNLHKKGDVAQCIDYMRNLHIKLDNAVADAYGWNDLDLSHGFHETKQGIRFTISEEARREILQRLLKLNHERYEEEVAQGLHSKKKTQKTSTPRKKKSNPDRDNDQLELFSFMNETSDESK